MRVGDVERSIYKGLCALDWRRFLCAMWLVCGNLQSLYEDLQSDAERSLIDSTLGTIRAVVMAGEVSLADRQEAAGLYAKWKVTIAQQEDDVPSGQWNMWMVFRNIAGEVAGAERLYESADRVNNAATFRWRDEEAESTGGLIVYDRDEVAEDSSPIAQTLEGLQRIVIGVSEISILIMEDVNWDPVKVRLRIVR